MDVADTLIGIFLQSVATHRRSDQFMRRGAGGWESISAERALADVEALALALGELGVGRGDHVALLSENRYEWAMTDLAVLGLGAVTVTIYPTLTAAQVRSLLENCAPKVLVVSTPAQLEKARAASSELARPPALVAMDPLPTGAPPLRPSGEPAREHALPTLLERGAALRTATPDAFRAAASAVRPDDVATIIYTAGTTGEPKGAM